VLSSEISWRPAASLLTPTRLDLVVKWRLFRALRDGQEPPSLYVWHILMRTGGREPGSWKQSLDDYRMAARDLLQSMRERGFDHYTPIKMNHYGHLVAGAHRVGCALALGAHVAVLTVDKKSPAAWDAAWFLARGCAPETVRQLERELEQLCASRSSTAA
jgi:hypothetical protein